MLCRVAAARNGSSGSRVQRVSRDGIGLAGEVERGAGSPPRRTWSMPRPIRPSRISYTVRPVLRGTELSGERAVRVPGAPAPVQQYLACRSIVRRRQRRSTRLARPPAQLPTARTTRASAISTATASSNSSSSGIRRTPRDNASAGLSGRQLLDAYTIDGTRLVADRSRAQHPRRRALHAVHGLRPRRRRPRRSGLQDGRRHRRRRRQGHRRRARRITARSSFRPTAFRCRPPTTRATARSSPARVLHDLRRAHRRRARHGRLSSRPRSDRRLGRRRRKRQQRQQLETAAIGSWPRSPIWTGAAERGHGPRLLRPLGLAAWDWRDGELTSRWVFDSGIGCDPSRIQPRRRSQGREITISPSPTSTPTARMRSSTAPWSSTITARVFSRPAAARRRDARQRLRAVAARPGSVRRARERGADDRPDAGHGAVRCADRRDLLEHAARRRRRPRHGGRHRPAIPGIRVLGFRCGRAGQRPGQRIADAPRVGQLAVWWDADLLREIEDANWITNGIGIRARWSGC